MNLRKPPIVEAWIEFHLRGSEAEATWPQSLSPFFIEIATEFPVVERQVEESFEVLKREASGLPREFAVQGKLRRVRAFDAQRHKCVQVGENVLVANLIKGNGPYEGFKLLLPTALAQFERYVRVFRPQSVLSAALHYTDVVKIPRASNGPVPLEDYFRIGVQVPDDASWPIGRLRLELSVPLGAVPGTPTDELVLGFRREPSDPAANEDRFRMDWHATCSGLATLDSNTLGARITAVHDALKERFRACFPPRTWGLFEEEAPG